MKNIFNKHRQTYEDNQIQLPGSSSLDSEAQVAVPKAVATHGRRWAVIISVASIVFLGLVTGVVTKAHQASQKASIDHTAKTQTIDLSDVSASAKPFQVDNQDKVVINGQLQANQNLVLTPGTQPQTPTTGLIYIDSTTNQVKYYDGTTYQTLASTNGLDALQASLNLPKDTKIVQSLQGLNGALSLLGSGGLSVTTTGKQISLLLPQNLTTTATPMFSSLTLLNPLAITSGGTGRTSFDPNGLVTTDTTGSLQSLTDNNPGECLVSGIGPGGGPGFGQCNGSALVAVTLLDGANGALTLDNSSANLNHIIIDDAKADGATKGIATFNSTNFDDNGSGTINTAQDISTSSTTIKFATLSLTNPLSLNLGSGAGGTTGSVKFKNATNGFGITLISPTGGSAPASGNINLTLPNTDGNPGECLITDGTGALSFTGCQLGGGGATGVTTLNGLIGSLTVANASPTGLTTIAINDAKADSSTLATKGIATFNDTDFSGNGVINTIQSITQGATPTFASLTLTNATSLNLGTGSGGTTGSIRFNNATNAFGINLQAPDGVVAGSTAPAGPVKLTLPSNGGTAANQCLTTDGTVNGNLSFSACLLGAGGGSNGLNTLNAFNNNVSILPTANEVNVANLSGTPSTITLTTPQDIHSGATPTFASLTLPTASSLKLGVPQGGPGTPATGSIVFRNSANANNMTLQSPNAIANNVALTLPKNAGGVGDCLVTDGTGILSFKSCLSGAGGANGGVISINGLSGAINILPTSPPISNRISVTTAGNTITLSTPQNIDNAAVLQFAGLNLNGNLTLGNSGSVNSNFLTQTGANQDITVDASNGGIITFKTGDGVTVNTFKFPAGSGVPQTICTTVNSCVAGGGTAVVLAPAAVQPNITANPSIYINNTAGANLLQLQNSPGGVPTDAFVVSGTGATTIGDHLWTLNGGADQLSIKANGRTFTFPAAGGTAAQEICTSLITCVAGGGTAVLMYPGSAQSNGSVNASLFINNTAGANLLQLQNNAADVFKVTSTGATTISGQTTLTNANSLNLGNSGSNNGSIKFNNLANANTITLLSPSGANAPSTKVYTLPVDNGNPLGGDCLKTDGSGNLSFSACLSGTVGGTGGVIDLNGLAGPVNILGTTDQVNVDSSVSGVIKISTPQDLNLASTTTKFTGLSLTGANALTLGNAAGNVGSMIFNNAGNANTVTLQSPANLGAGNTMVLTLPDTVGLPGQCLGTATGNGTLTFVNCLSGLGGGGNGVSKLNNLTGILMIPNSSGAGTNITFNTAKADKNDGTGTKGIATFSSTDFNTTGGPGIIDTVQDISLASTTTKFTGLSLTGANALTLGNAAGNVGSMIFNNAGNANTVTLQSPANLGAGNTMVLTLPDTVGLPGQCLGTATGNGTLTFVNCLSGLGGGGNGVSKLNNLTGILMIPNSSGAGTNITFNTAKADKNDGTGTKGIATFSSTDFNTTGGPGIIDTVQDISLASTTTKFTGLSLTGANALTLGNAAGNVGSMIFNNAGNANTVTLQSPANLGAGNTITFTLPDTGGNILNPNQCLMTDGTGVLSFNTCNGNAYVNNGNSFLAPGILGTNDAGSTLTFRTNGKAGDPTIGNRLTLDASANGSFTPGAVTFTTLNGGTHTLGVATTASANTAGDNLTIAAGAGNGTGNGGTLMLQGGAAGASGTNGGVLVKNTANNTNSFSVQNSSSGHLLDVDTTNSKITFNLLNTGEITAWTTANTTPVPPSGRAQGSSVISNGYMYNIGGIDAFAVPLATVLYTKLNADGSNGTWNSATSLPGGVGLNYQSSVAANGYIYILGGCTGLNCGGSSAINNVYYAKQNVDGSLGAWQNATSLPAARGLASAVVANGYVYLIGGSTFGTNAFNTVYYAKLNANGSLGSWTTTSGGSLLPTPLWGHTSVVANGYVYAIGGNSGSIVQTGTYYAKLNADGSIGNWQSTVSLPLARQLHASVVANGYVYVIGGSNAATNVGTVYYNKLNSDGTLGPTWTLAASAFPGVVRGALNSGIANGYIYAVGGFDGSSTTTTVYYTSTERIQSAGSLDLVGISGSNLADVGATGGSLTAGNTDIVGDLQIQGMANFAGSASIGGLLSASGDVAFRDLTNSTNAFQIQNATGTNIFNVDTTNTRVGINNSAPGNLVSINALSTADGLGQLAIGTNGTTNEGLVVQGVVGQSGALAAFENNSATPLLSIKSDGSLLGNTTNGGGNGLLLSTNAGTTQACLQTSGLTINGDCTSNSIGLKVTPKQFNNKGLLVQASNVGGAQSSDLQQFQDASNNVLSGFNNVGNLYLGRAAGATGTVQFFSSGGGNTGSITLSPAAPAAGIYTITIPAETGTICTNASTTVCNTAGSGYVALDPNSAGVATAQPDGTAYNSIFINKTNATGNLLTFNRGGTTIASIGNTGAVLFQNSANQANAFQVLDQTGNQFINLNTSTGALSLGSTTGGAGAGSITEKVGTGGYSLDGAAGSNYSFGPSTVAGNITIGGTTQTGTTTLGQSTATNTINIGNGATSNGNSQTINIGAGADTGTGQSIVTVGNSNGTSATVVQGGITTLIGTAVQQSFTIPLGVYSINILASGGSAGPGGQNTCGGGNPGGNGGTVSATYPVTPGQVIYYTAGGQGVNPANCQAGTAGTGGTGAAGTPPNDDGGGAGGNGGGDSGGGGASDVRLGANTLAARIVTAGGGGGGGDSSGPYAGWGAGGAGGGVSCAVGTAAGGTGGPFAGGGGGGFVGGAGGTAVNGQLSYGGGGGSSCAGPSATNVVYTPGNNPGVGSVIIKFGQAIFLQTGASGGTAGTIQIGNTSGANIQNINIGTNTAVGSTNNVNIGSFAGGTTTIQSSGGVSVNLLSGAATSAICSTLANGVSPSANTTYKLYDCQGSASADFAEMYPAASDVVVGDVVAQGSTQVPTYDTDSNGNIDWTKLKGTTSQVVKATTPYSSNLIGVASDNYGDFGSVGNNIKSSDNPKSVALVGRVNVKVTNENGSIAPGDFLTASATMPGYAMKATQAGYVIGQALNSFNDPTGMVMVFVRGQYYAGPTISNTIQNGDTASLASLTISGNLTESGLSTLTDLTVTGSTTLANLTVNGNSTFNGTLSVNGHIISSNTSGTTSFTPGTASCSGTTTNSQGNDTSGKIVINTGSSACAAGVMANVSFAHNYANPPNVVITPGDAGTATAGIKYYVTPSTTGYNLSTATSMVPNQTYTYYYHTIQ